MAHHPTSSTLTTSRFWLAAGITVAVLLLTALVLFLDLETMSSWDLRNNLWGPAHLLLQGQSPYDISVLFDEGRAVWMPVGIGALFPLGFLPFQQAANLWFLGTIAALLAIVHISSNDEQPHLLLLAGTVIALFLFLPTIMHLRLGQFTVFATLILLIVVLQHGRMSPLLSVLLLAITLTKPQISFLVIPGYLLSIARDDGWQVALRRALLLLAASVTLLIPLFVAEPDWIGDFITAVQGNRGWLQPSARTFLTLSLGAPGAILGTALAVLVVGLNLGLWWKLQPREAIFWSLALTPLATPYIWSWDFVVIIPLVVRTLFQARRKLSVIVLALTYLASWVLVLQIVFTTDVSNHRYWWIPWLFVGAVAVVRQVESRE